MTVLFGSGGGGFKLLPPPSGVCQQCGVNHPPEQPHDALSMHYQYWFYGKHGRWPTWKDAIQHCTPEVQACWEAELQKRKAWTAPKSIIPDAMPTGDGAIGCVTIGKLKPKKRKRK